MAMEGKQLLVTMPDGSSLVMRDTHFLIDRITSDLRKVGDSAQVFFRNGGNGVAQWITDEEAATHLGLDALSPDGVPQHAPGAKLDGGKPRVGLVLSGFSKAIREVSRIGTYGANKYTDNGWESVKNGEERYSDAMLRHWLEAKDSPDDPESGLPHLAHMAWNALAVLELYLRNQQEAK